MVTFVDNHVAVVRDTIINDTFPDEALNHGDIEQTAWSVSSAADAANRFRGLV